LAFVCGGYEPAALVEKMGFCFFWPSKERVFNFVFLLTAGAAMIYPANPLPFIASDAAVVFIRICLLFFKALMVSAKSLGLVPFLLQKKERHPRK
jgi:hypothetical protein